jgi:prophage regulatory protein
MPDTDNLRLLDWFALRPKVPYTRTHLSRLEKRGLFPRRVQVGAGRVAWLSDEIDAWIRARAAARDQAHREP